MAYKNLLLETHEGIALVTINRREKLNALNMETLSELSAAFTALAQNDRVRGILITGSGQKAFAAGADVSEILPLSYEQGVDFARNGQNIFRQIEGMSKPVIALVNGFALGGGCELAMACHMRIASDQARFGQPEVNLGLIPGYGGTQRLTRLIGRGLATQYLISGEMIDAKRALEIGLVNQVVAPDQLLETGKTLLKKILSKAPLSVRYVLESIHQGIEVTLDQALEIEAENFGKSCASEDMKEGITAFLEKRPAHFKGR